MRFCFSHREERSCGASRKIDETRDDQIELIKTNIFFSLRFLNFIYGYITCVCTGHDHRSDNCVGEQRGLWRRGYKHSVYLNENVLMQHSTTYNGSVH